MDLLPILPIVVGLWCVAFLVRAVAVARRGGPFATGWAVKATLALLGVGAAVALGSETALYGVSAGWALLLVVPALAAQGQARELAGLRFERARVYAEIVRLLHPIDGWRGAPDLMRALARAQAGDVSVVPELRRRLAADDLPAGARPYVWGEIARLTGDWDGLLALRGPTHPATAGLRLRALGETGRLVGLADEHARLEEPDPFADLMLFAFSGRKRGVAALIGGAPFAALSPSAKDFWRATAAIVADPGDAAARALVQASAAGPQRDALVARRLGGRLGARAALDPETSAAIDRLEHDVVTAMAATAPAVRRRPIVTAMLIAANVAAFGAEIVVGGWGGPTDLDTLYQLGALWPPSVLEDGEWWRLGSAMFLHFGALHLALNMLALALFGRRVELRVGPWRMAALYALAGLGSMAGVLALGAFRGAEPDLLVGASGAIFGVVGAFGALLVTDVREGRRGARRRLIELGAIVALQIAFDALTPEISMSAHAFGFVLGLVAGLALSGVTRRRS
ncbi:rhomboid family intramembrane serine protease [Methylopila sp. 73B]|uniref:rhomboid family intramembrane serine protease n=1 Tax=Methylopila sp. 73B TaxID=1120792 RepID=UPI0003807E7F|nr:rhomboid family intramembrane serine protease [Methylopila sp. 73B]